MSRWIDIADAIKIMACEMYAEAQSQGFDVDSVEDFIPEAKAWMNDAPSIDIVHCFECKYGEYRKDHDDYLCKDDGLCVHDADFYCADGERRDDEAD